MNGQRVAAGTTVRPTTVRRDTKTANKSLLKDKTQDLKPITMYNDTQLSLSPGFSGFRRTCTYNMCEPSRRVARPWRLC